MKGDKNVSKTKEMLTLEEARKNAGYQYANDMAKALGLSKQCYCGIENYETKLKADVLLKFCDLTGVNARELKIKGYNY